MSVVLGGPPSAFPPADLDVLLAEGRERAQSLMESTVRIRRQTGEARNQANGRVETTWTTIYEGPARLRFAGGQPREVDVAGQRLAEQSPTVCLPIGADSRITVGSSAAVRVDDEGEVLDNDPDSGIEGATFRVAGVHEQTHSTQRRLPVEVHSHGG